MVGRMESLLQENGSYIAGGMEIISTRPACRVCTTAACRVRTTAACRVCTTAACRVCTTATMYSCRRMEAISLGEWKLYRWENGNCLTGKIDQGWKNGIYVTGRVETIWLGEWKLYGWKSCNYLAGRIEIILLGEWKLWRVEAIWLVSESKRTCRNRKASNINHQQRH